MGNDQDDTVLIPYTTSMERVEGIDYLRRVYVVAKDDEGIDRLQADIENLLRVRHNIKDTNLDDFNIQNMKSIMETVAQTTGTFTLFLGAVACDFSSCRWHWYYEHHACICNGTDSRNWCA